MIKNALVVQEFTDDESTLLHRVDTTGHEHFRGVEIQTVPNRSSVDIYLLGIFPFTAGQSLVWDATCSDSFSCSNLIKSASDPGSVARQAEECKVTKYRTLSDRFHFVLLAVETSGIIGPRGTSLLHRIDGLLAGQRG